MNEIEVEITVPIKIKFHYDPPMRGSRDSMGVPESPDDPEEVELLEATPTHADEKYCQKMYKCYSKEVLLDMAKEQHGEDTLINMVLEYLRQDAMERAVDKAEYDYEIRKEIW